MTRPAEAATLLAVPAVQTPAAHAQSLNQLSSGRSSSPAANPAADDHASNRQHDNAAGGGTVPHSEGLLGRERAAKRKQLSVSTAPDDLIHRASDRHKLRKLHTPGADLYQASSTAKQGSDALDRYNARHGLKPAVSTPEPEERILDALDRFNAKRGYSRPVEEPSSAAQGPATSVDPVRGRVQIGSSNRLLIQASQHQPGRHDQMLSQRPHNQLSHQVAQRPSDALDMYNMRKGHAKVTANDSSSDQQQPFRSLEVHQIKAQRPLDALDRFNARKGQSPASQATQYNNSAASPIKEDTANDSQQSQTTSVEPEQVTRRHGKEPAVLGECSVAGHTPKALVGVNSVLLARHWSRDPSLAIVDHAASSPEATQSSTHTQTGGSQQNMAAGTSAFVPRGRMYGFDDDASAVETAAKSAQPVARAVTRGRPAGRSALPAGGLRSNQAVLQGSVFKRLG